MAAYNTETVLSVHHWNDTLFSFTTTRNKGLRFRSGHFLMIGLEVEGKPLVRAYSVASPNYEEHLEFLSIKVQDGPLTSRLQKIKVGDATSVFWAKEKHVIEDWFTDIFGEPVKGESDQDNEAIRSLFESMI